jgi:hypothetical protein
VADTHEHRILDARHTGRDSINARRARKQLHKRAARWRRGRERAKIIAAALKAGAADPVFEAFDPELARDFLAAVSTRRVIIAAEEDYQAVEIEVNNELNALLAQSPQVIAIEHDWFKAFGDDEEFRQSAWRLPFPVCVFGLKLGWMVFVVLVQEHEDRKHFWFFDGPANIWTHTGAVLEQDGRYSIVRGSADETEREHIFKIQNYLIEYIKAACVVLDAEVAAAVPAPQRGPVHQKAGPLPDFRVVQLLSRRRKSHFEGASTDRHLRCHWRRAHWRQLDSSRRTWVRAAIIGDPDLGWIEQYRLV